MTIRSIKSTASQAYDKSSFDTLCYLTEICLIIVFPGECQRRIGSNERADQYWGCDGRIPSGIQLSNMTVLCCHFARSGGYDPLIKPLAWPRSSPPCGGLERSGRKDDYSSSISIAARPCTAFLAETGFGRRTLIEAASRVLLICAA